MLAEKKHVCACVRHFSIQSLHIISTYFYTFPSQLAGLLQFHMRLHTIHSQGRSLLRHRSALLRAMLQLGALLPKEPYFPTCSFVGFTWFKHPWS